MSRFFSKKYKNLTPYTPGEQPRDMKYIKLNTNESPYPPSEKAIKEASLAAQRLQLYPDPACKALNEALAEAFGVTADEILVTNGSDEILNFAFAAFCDEESPALFADITYGFYEVFAELYGIPYEKKPLREDFTLNLDDYKTNKATLFIANPNAPTGIAITPSEVEDILKANPDRVAVIDEAYVDFGAQSCVPLIKKYSNLLVTQTFSKSRSMAGARLGVGFACPELIRDLNTIKYSTNPYNINSMTMAAGIGVLADAEYTAKNCRSIIENREYLIRELKALGFTMTDSVTNFVFARHNTVGGGEIYKALKEKGILVRHFTGERICEYNRITVGCAEDMKTLVAALKIILEEKK